VLPPGDGSPKETAEQERERLIAELERDLSKRPGVGVLPPVAAIALAGSLFLMWWMRADVEYFFSARDAIELGAEGDYHPERALPNRYVQLHGMPSERGWYVQEKDGDFVIVGVNDLPVLVHRATFNDEQRDAAGKRPKPRPNSLFVKGRLRSRDEASKYAEVFTQFDAWSGTSSKWLLMAEQPPGRDFGAVAMFGFLAAFATLNTWLFARGLARQRG
jgi:hypothetical protein